MIKLFSGTSNPNLSSKVASELKVSLAKAEVVRFENSEVRVRIEENVKDQTCVVIQPTSNPTDTHIIELIFFCDALKRSNAKKVVAVIPYFGYARQNRQHRPGEDVSANVIVKILEAVGFDEVMTFDIHDEGTEGIFTIPFRSLSALPTLAQRIKEDLGNEEVAIISPDQGGVERTRTFANAYFGDSDHEIVIIEKRRNLDKIHESDALELFGDVKGKVAVIVDDIVTSGGTLIHAVDLCVSKGASRVLAAIVHPDLSAKAPARLQGSRLEKFYTSDTILLRAEQKFPKLTEISVGPIIAKELKSLE